jgi:hypothetical protein
MQSEIPVADTNRTRAKKKRSSPVDYSAAEVANRTIRDQYDFRIAWK